MFIVLAIITVEIFNSFAHRKDMFIRVRVVIYYLNILWNLFGRLIEVFLNLFFPFNKKDKLNLILTIIQAAFQYIGGHHLPKEKL